MKLIIAGGTGQIGEVLARDFRSKGHTVKVLTRNPKDSNQVAWDGKSKGAWFSEIDGCDVVINLAGRTVNCRYSEENLRQMMDSRVDSTRIVGQAISESSNPPALWLQMSTATIYAHRFDAPNDELTGVIGGNEPDAPAYWSRSIDIAKAWEEELRKASTPRTRKIAMRTAMLMSPDSGGIFDVLSNLTRLGLGGPVGSGAQYVSWIHEQDFLAAVHFVIEKKHIEGAINFSSPGPLPQREFMKLLQKAWGVPIGLPATAWMAEIGAFFLRTDTELLLKSRRVVPARLIREGFLFKFSNWAEAVRELVTRHS